MQGNALHKTPYSLYILAILVGIAATWASLQGFHYLFLAPVLLAVLIFSVFRTEKFILLAGSLAPLSMNINDIGGGLGLALPTEPLIIYIFVLLVFRMAWVRDYNSALLLHPMSLVIVAYLVWLWISSAFSTMPLVSFKFTFARTWYIVVFYFALIQLFKNYNNIHFFIKALTVFTLALVVFVLIKHAADGFVRSSSYGISWPFFPDHGMYAAAIAFCVPALAFYAINGREMGHAYFWSFVSGFFLLVLLFGIIVSYTRATWLSLIAAAAMYLWLRFKLKFVWIIVGLVAITAIGISRQDQIMYSLEANKQGSSDELEGHVKSVSNITTDPSNLERINRWKCAARMVSEKPITGFGPGTFVFQYAPFQKSSELTIISTHAGDLGDAHSEYFSSLAETGWPGFALWVLIVVVSVSTAFKIIYNSQIRKVRITALIALLGLITYYSHALLNNYTQYDKIAVPMWGFIAILVALDVYYLRNQPTATPSNEKTLQP